MEEKVTLKCESSDGEVISMRFNSEGMTIYEFASELRRFALAVGYLPESVNKVFVDEE